MFVYHRVISYFSRFAGDEMYIYIHTYIYIYKQGNIKPQTWHLGHHHVTPEMELELSKPTDEQ